jgi:hypothetical protein
VRIYKAGQDGSIAKICGRDASGKLPAAHDCVDGFSVHENYSGAYSLWGHNSLRRERLECHVGMVVTWQGPTLRLAAAEAGQQVTRKEKGQR